MFVYIPQIISFNSTDICVSEKSVDALTLKFTVSLVLKKGKNCTHTQTEKTHFPP